MPNALQFTGLGVYGKTCDGIMPTVGSINKFSVPRNFDVRTGVLAAIKTAGQGAGAMSGFQKPCSSVQGIGGNTVTLFVVAINDR